jgi:hypothetical protein
MRRCLIDIELQKAFAKATEEMAAAVSHLKRLARCRSDSLLAAAKANVMTTTRTRDLAMDAFLAHRKEHACGTAD